MLQNAPHWSTGKMLTQIKLDNSQVPYQQRCNTVPNRLIAVTSKLPIDIAAVVVFIATLIMLVVTDY